MTLTEKALIGTIALVALYGTGQVGGAAKKEYDRRDHARIEGSTKPSVTLEHCLDPVYTPNDMRTPGERRDYDGRNQNCAGNGAPPTKGYIKSARKKGGEKRESSLDAVGRNFGKILYEITHTQDKMP